MNPPDPRPAVVLCCAGHDPSGGAGLTADVEAVCAQAAHATSLVTCLTVQDSRNVSHLQPLDAAALLEQGRCLLADLSIDAMKLGLLGSAAMAQAVVELADDLARQHPAAPLVIDPILRAGGGAELASTELLQVLREQLLPRSLLITPNLAEARALAQLPDGSHDRCAVRLHAIGARWVLITGGDEDTEQVCNRLYAPDGNEPVKTWQWPRLPGRFHGSGCTLAAALTAKLAQGVSPADAADAAQRYTQHCLEHAYALGAGQAFPARRPGIAPSQ